jgi:hypothetical protein
MVAACLCLWRAVFLGDMMENQKTKIAHAESFLRKMLVDNSIGFSTDIASRQRTFDFYIFAARHHLDNLINRGLACSETKAHFLPLNLPQERWGHLQNVPEEAITFFHQMTSGNFVPTPSPHP